ncbi:nucleotidyltransferase substrate binding protein [Spirosoma luteum]|uniref:nucleotidyltransferase substrate binding protein n=1 Tax=Spirosoma luteum TaxID=431553 RepID=UPI000367E927|nr:nucleotidyltransferase substrate binding protein [Spirosoma luteum]
MAKRWQERHDFYQKALTQLSSGLALYPNLNELEKDGAIQRFEFTFELAWKTLQDYLAQQAGYTDVKGPRPVLKQAVQDGLLIDGYTWIQMLDRRNALTHVYDEAESREILEVVSTTYLPLLMELNTVLLSKR